MALARPPNYYDPTGFRAFDNCIDLSEGKRGVVRANPRRGDRADVRSSVPWERAPRKGRPRSGAKKRLVTLCTGLPLCFIPLFFSIPFPYSTFSCLSFSRSLASSFPFVFLLFRHPLSPMPLSFLFLPLAQPLSAPTLFFLDLFPPCPFPISFFFLPILFVPFPTPKIAGPRSSRRCLQIFGEQRRSKTILVWVRFLCDPTRSSVSDRIPGPVRPRMLCPCQRFRGPQDNPSDPRRAFET